MCQSRLDIPDENYRPCLRQNLPTERTSGPWSEGILASQCRLPGRVFPSPCKRETTLFFQHMPARCAAAQLGTGQIPVKGR